MINNIYILLNINQQLLQMKKQAFTLIELSISLIIITMLISVIVTGSSIIQNAKNRQVISEYNFYRAAISNFRLQYNQFPGDFSDAYNYWPNDCSNTNCNGNGNGIIEYNGNNNDDESLRAWQHLALSEFISGSYPGTRTVTNQNEVGNNIPSSKILSTGWSFYNKRCYTNDNINTLIFGAFRSGSINDSAAITTRDAYDIDKKMDDASARTGSIIGLYSDDALGKYCTGSTLSNNACVQDSSQNSTKSGYYYVNVNNGRNSCALQFLF
ncbi:MAG: prepilin-type N-terminal cleavage/methylation domain-containing protein [Rickettsiales bacterium]|nr:MAG: prepilin-type N-terminal cleavage/methylation domain-containing protein [Rickettsiales bacterium]